MATRSMYISESQVAGWDSVGVYSYDESTLTTTLLSNYSPSSDAMTCYELRYFSDQGSWWLFVAPSANVPQSWWDNGGASNFQASGNIPTDGIMYPTVLVWWIPSETFEQQNIQTTIISGDIQTPIPRIPPTDTPPDDNITVTQTSDGVIVTVPPSQSATTVTISTST